MKCLLVLISVLFVFTTVFASQPDYLERASDMLNYTGAEDEDEKMWMHYLSLNASYKVETIDSFFSSAAQEFKVPVQLLKVIGYLENNWVQIGPSIDRGWGIMHLVENDYCDTLGEAAKLIQSDKQALKDDPEQNIRGAAALIAHYARQLKIVPQRMEDWFPAISRFSGLATQELRDQQAYRYYSILKNGVRELNIYDQEVKISAEKGLQIESLRPVPAADRASVDYPGAKASITKYNFTSGRSHDIDTWVVHYIGVGTYAGAISWFNNSKAKASAHFCIRQTDGEITQVVRTGDTAWHCGAKLGPGKKNNQRSIGIEHEATVSHPEWWKSEAMLKESAKLTSYFCKQYDIPKKHSFPGIIGHLEMPDCSTDCPGACPWDQLMEYITGEPGGSGGNGDDDASSFIIAYVDCPGDTANIRKGPGMSYSVVTTLGDGSIIHIFKQQGNWFNIQIPEGSAGWIYKDLAIHAINCAAAKAKDEIELRTGPSSEDSVISIVSTGTSLVVLGENGDWSRVRLADGTVGYVETTLIEIQ